MGKARKAAGIIIGIIGVIFILAIIGAAVKIDDKTTTIDAATNTKDSSYKNEQHSDYNYKNVTKAFNDYEATHDYEKAAAILKEKQKAQEEAAMAEKKGSYYLVRYPDDDRIIPFDAFWWSGAFTDADGDMSTIDGKGEKKFLSIVVGSQPTQQTRGNQIQTVTAL
jgi:hypothetical protein